MKKRDQDREQIEFDRLSELYRDIPDNKRELVDGLIRQAARLRVSLDDLWKDIQENGNCEVFQQGNDAFERERPNSKIFTARDKNYLSIIKKLDELLPGKEKSQGFDRLNDDDD